MAFDFGFVPPSVVGPGPPGDSGGFSASLFLGMTIEEITAYAASLPRPGRIAFLRAYDLWLAGSPVVWLGDVSGVDGMGGLYGSGSWLDSDDFLGDFLLGAALVGLGFGVGYYVGGLSTMLGAKAAALITNPLLATAAQITVTAAVAYTASALGEWALAEYEHAGIVMGASYVGGILGGAQYVVSQVPTWQDAVELLYIETPMLRYLGGPAVTLPGDILKVGTTIYDNLTSFPLEIFSVDFGSETLAYPMY